MALTGLKLISFESRRGDLVEKLVREQGGECFNAPSVRELPLEENESCLGLARDLIDGRYDALLLLTGVGTQYLIDAARAIDLEQPLLEALGRVAIVARGPKPVAVLRRYGLRAAVRVPEPNTWLETVEAVRGLGFKTVAVQEYGVSNPALLESLRAQGREVTPVPVYRWAKPLDLEPLEEAARRITAGDCDIALFLSSVQLTHLLEIAREAGLRDSVLERLSNEIVVASIGPVMTEALRSQGVEPNFIPSHPKLAICIRELAEQVDARTRKGPENV